MHVGRDSAFGIATRYRVGGPQIVTPVKARFSIDLPFQTGPGTHQASCKMDTRFISQE